MCSISLAGGIDGEDRIPGEDLWRIHFDFQLPRGSIHGSSEKPNANFSNFCSGEGRPGITKQLLAHGCPLSGRQLLKQDYLSSFVCS